MKIFVRIHESRIYQTTVEAASLKEGRAQAMQLYRDGELPADILDVEPIAVEHPCEGVSLCS